METYIEQHISCQANLKCIIYEGFEQKSQNLLNAMALVASRFTGIRTSETTTTIIVITTKANSLYYI